MPRLPSSLKWLIDRRARVAGEIAKIETLLAECHRLADEIRPMKELLASIDQTLALHDVRVDVALIQPIRSHDVRISLPYGELTRAILLCLKLNDGTPVATDAIAAFISVRYADLAANASPMSDLRESIRYRLTGLKRQGLIKRFDSNNRGRVGVWVLAHPEQDLPT